MSALMCPRSGWMSRYGPLVGTGAYLTTKPASMTWLLSLKISSRQA